jgi:cytochrome o ubiquinol oxidase subunit 3
MAIQVIKDGKLPPMWHYGHDDHDVISTKTLGFWLYMLSDALIFAGIFAAYAVLDHSMNYADGPTEAQIVHPIAAFAQTVAVLSSVLAYSLATVAMKNGNKRGTLIGIAVAMVLGAGFIALELADFARMFAMNATPDRSGFLSAFYVLIATHGIHMLFGILWLLVMAVQVVRFGFTTPVVAQMLNLRLFWQFQAAVWVCVYVFVYLKGSI